MDKLRILIVEDDKTTQKLYDAFLLDNIFEKRLIKNGEEAFETYREWKPGIMILDLMLPALSGYVILKKIREEMRDTSTPILISSSLTTKGDVLECSKLGVQGYLAKPIPWKEIVFRILECYQKAYPDKADYVAALKRILQEEKDKKPSR